MPLYTKFRQKADLSMIKEPLITLNQYNRPVELEGQDAQVLLITRLILMEPGLIQTHPDMGVGLVSMFRYSTELDVKNLKDRIAKQIQTYLPMFTTVEVKVDLDNQKHLLYIYVNSDQINAMIPFDTENYTVIDGLDTMIK